MCVLDILVFAPKTKEFWWLRFIVWMLGVEQFNSVSALFCHTTLLRTNVGVPNHLCFPATVTLLGPSAVPHVLCHHKDNHSTDKHTRLKQTLDPWPYLQPGPPDEIVPCFPRES